MFNDLGCRLRLHPPRLRRSLRLPIFPSIGKHWGDICIPKNGSAGWRRRVASSFFRGTALKAQPRCAASAPCPLQYHGLPAQHWKQDSRPKTETRQPKAQWTQHCNASKRTYLASAWSRNWGCPISCPRSTGNKYLY